MALTIGLTGGIASGKTLAAETFLALGVPVLDADSVAREVVRPGTPALEQIKEAFGPDYIQADGALDRARLRRRVFADPAARQQLERITHPAIRARLTRWRDAQTAPYSVLAVPILIESGMDALVDRVLVIDAPVAEQLRRLIARDGIPETLARQMLAAQATRAERLRRADDVVSNDGTPDDMRAALRAMHERYLGMARQPRIAGT